MSIEISKTYLTKCTIMLQPYYTEEDSDCGRWWQGSELPKMVMKALGAYILLDLRTSEQRLV